MKSKNKNNTHVVFINSVKGGAGKTTIALTLAVSAFRDLAIKTDSEASLIAAASGAGVQKTTTPSICYVDADLLGTGVAKILFGDEQEINFFNDYRADYKSYIKPISLEGLESLPNVNYGSLECILLSDDPEKKGKFIKQPQVRSDQVNMNIFTNRFKKLLTKLIKSEKYEYIIVDCSPGYDSLSCALMQSAIAQIESDNIKSLFITTLDTAHMHVTMSLACHILLTGSGIINPTIVVNDTGNYLRTGSTHPNTSVKSDLGFKKDIEPNMREDMWAKCKQIKMGNMDYDSSADIEDIQIKLHKYTAFTDSMIYTYKKHINKTTEWKSLDLNSFKDLLGG